MADELTDIQRKAIGGQLSGLSSSYGGKRGKILAEAAEAILSGGSPDLDALETALTWSQLPNPAIAKAVRAFGGDASVAEEDDNGDQAPAKKTAAKKTTAASK